MRVVCASCFKHVKVDEWNYLVTHRNRDRDRCAGSGRHIDFNAPKEK